MVGNHTHAHKSTVDSMKFTKLVHTWKVGYKLCSFMLSAVNTCERFVTQLLCMNEVLITNDIAHCNTEYTHIIV
jgi:hypothetical protein